MGKAIESIALKRGHTIVCKIDKNTEGEISYADLAINFSTPTSALQNIEAAIKMNIPVVSGTTGWSNDLKYIEKIARKNKVGFLHSSNFSLGMNLFFQLNKSLSKIMNTHNYSTELIEAHHFKKIDSPSGTAISLANDIISNSSYKEWSSSDAKKDVLRIKSIRKEDIPGTHSIFYSSEFDEISIKHMSFSRSGFALGAIIAAEWLKGKNGIFSMSDVLKIK